MDIVMHNAPLQTAIGDKVVAFTNAKTLNTSLSRTNMQRLNRWYKEDPKQNHLGMIEYFGYIARNPQPAYLGMLRNNAVIEVNGYRGNFTYDLPFAEKNEVMTVEDTSNKYSKAGIDGSIFEISLNRRFEQGDVITYDVYNGVQARVSEMFEVRTEGNKYRHFCQVVGNQRADYFPKEFLRPGIRFFKVGHAMGEYSVHYSSYYGDDVAGTKSCMFTLGNHFGVDGRTTGYAGSKSLSMSDDMTKKFLTRAMEQQANLQERLKFDAEALIIASQMPNGKLNMNTAVVASLMEFFCLSELAKMEASINMFQRGGEVDDNDGNVLLNEGFYHQLRRGYRIKYAKPGGINKEVLSRIYSYVFRNSDVPITERRITLKAGMGAYENIMKVINDEALSQLQTLGDRNLMGSDRILPSNPVTGALTNLQVGPVIFTSVMLQGLGWISVTHEPSLDWMPMADRSTRGDMIGLQYPITSYSAIIEDVTDRASSNAFSRIPRGVDMQGVNNSANVFYIRPKNGAFQWGTRHGRWSSTQNGGIESSMMDMAEEFWCHASSAVWIKDPTRFVLLELAA